ncbi:MAG: hypothetical protein Q4D53_06595 [Leptotrichiaceae bacterium]|nr:hypothetical protein [Leptotrichiaceae bacterium]
MSKSRADYFKERRKKLKTFSVNINKELAEKLESKLEEKKTKTSWLIEKIKEEINE